MSRWHTSGVRWLKFNVVGGVGIVVQLGALEALTAGLHLNYLAATALAVEAAVLHNFVWHERYTWADRPRLGRAVSRLLQFNLTTGTISILGNLALMRLFTGEGHVPPLLANLLAIAACSLANFLVSDRVVFRASLPPVNPVRDAPH